jgi:OOP family OmpA-OmpF porin
VNTMTLKAAALPLLAVAATSAPAAFAQELEPVTAQARGQTDSQITVFGEVPSDISNLPEGPELEGFISSRTGNRVQLTSANGVTTEVRVADVTDIRSTGGFLGLSKNTLGTDALFNGLPVTVQTVEFDSGLLASRIRFKNGDLETARMIHSGTNQRFARNEEMIEENAAATEALRGRVANIDQYNIRGTTNVYFDTGKWELSPQAEYQLCTVAQQAADMDNAVLLVVGYTDNVGDEDYNQVLSERRAGRVVNFLQQRCSWQPWRMMTPTGMSESDPLADNTTGAGRAQNRRVSVNILTSKALEG